MTAMYQSHFGFIEAPFSIAPDPRYLYMSQRHQEALAHLLYGLRGDGGFVLLTGEVGAGKTTLCRCLLEQVPESCDVAYIFNPKLTVGELLSTLCVEFGIEHPAGNNSVKLYIDGINRHLLDAHARGRNTVLIIDEAQNLSVAVLEQMRLLTNLETSQRKLLQIILIGQPELAVMLDQPELRQLAQRIVARYHLGPLSRQELAAYVGHRLDVAGGRRHLFPKALMGHLFRLSGGVPRVINVLCDRALLGAFVEGRERVDRATLVKAADEVLHRPPRPQGALLHSLLALLVFVAGLAVATTVYRQEPTVEPMPLPLRVAAVKPPAVAPAPTLAAVQPPLADTLEWPAGQPRAQDRALAFAALLQAWGIVGEGANPCRQAESYGLRCRTQRGGLDELRQLDRPAILRLRDAGGEEFQATLTGLEGKGARFSVGGDTVVVSLNALAAQWSGHYTLLWRPPLDVGDSLRPGARGPAVNWLATQLNRAEGNSLAAPANPVFDADMVLRLKQYQLAQGLIPDSSLGPQTLLRLSGVGDSEAPRLSAAAKAK